MSQSGLASQRSRAGLGVGRRFFLRPTRPRSSPARRSTWTAAHGMPAGRAAFVGQPNAFTLGARRGRSGMLFVRSARSRPHPRRSDLLGTRRATRELPRPGGSTQDSRPTRRGLFPRRTAGIAHDGRRRADARFDGLHGRGRPGCHRQILRRAGVKSRLTLPVMER